MKKATSIPFGNRPPFYLSTLSKGSAQSQIEGLKKQAHASKQATHPVLNNNKDGKQLQLVSDPEFAKEHYGFALAKDRSDDLLAKLNSGIGKIKADGTYDTIYQKWFGNKTGSAPANASAAKSASAPASAPQ